MQENKALAKVEAQQTANLVALGKAAEQDAREMVAVATSQAKVLAEIIESKHLFTMLHDKKHVNVEGWATAGTFRNLAAGVDKTEAIRNADGTTVGYQAHAVVRNILTGVQVSEAWQTCLLEEKMWAGRPLPNLYSMAGTRACSKALRLCLSWVMVLAGFDATPAEEMDGVKGEKPAPQEAPRGLCPTHKVPFVRKTGTSKAGKPYDFWACSADVKPWCQEKPAEAPARAPAAAASEQDRVDAAAASEQDRVDAAAARARMSAPAKVVDSTARPAPTGGVPDPQNLGEVMMLAKDRKGMGFQDVLAFFAARKVEEIRITPAEAWAKLNKEKPDVAGAPLFPPKEG